MLSKETELIINCKDVPRELCMDDEFIHDTLIKAADLMGMKVRASASYNANHDTPPGSIVFVMVDKSFLYTHTFADKKRMTIRVFTCGDADPMKGWIYIKRAFKLAERNFTIKEELMEY